MTKRISIVPAALLVLSGICIAACADEYDPEQLIDMADNGQELPPGAGIIRNRLGVDAPIEMMLKSTAKGRFKELCTASELAEQSGLKVDGWLKAGEAKTVYCSAHAESQDK